MNVKILTLVIVLLLSLLCSGGAGPMASAGHGKEVEESHIRRLAQQNPARSAQSHRPAGWRRRRPRPRLSHKGPMPF
ncbi:apelin [Scleropages formosus]|uniref:apelin n=1 Tax=Scleropages formosus TaxID=113540 RepID=UPI00087886D6|nr:apelin [Scleropages formosus]